MAVYTQTSCDWCGNEDDPGMLEFYDFREVYIDEVDDTFDCCSDECQEKLIKNELEELRRYHEERFTKNESDHVLVAGVKDIALKHLDSTPHYVLEELLAVVSKMERKLGGK